MGPVSPWIREQEREQSENTHARVNRMLHICNASSAKFENPHVNILNKLPKSAPGGDHM
ncbi:hypothetical protein MCP1_740003 [Candidatus Terasakiella magnetica]|nr:hypothetical protein MCP1_740003 [Candidatus Terasakiella magnetica]